MSDFSRSITVANEATIRQVIASAQQRLVVLLPAPSIPIAEALCAQWKKLGPDRVNVVVDLDPEVFRLGYGDFEGVKLLESTAQSLGTMIHRQRGIRIGVIVADKATLVFTPTPALVDRRLLQGVSQRGVRRSLSQAGRRVGSKTSITAFAGTVGDLGLWDRADDWQGQFFGRFKPDTALEAAHDRQSFRRGRKHRTEQVASDSEDAQDSPVRSPMDVAEPDGRQPIDLDAGSERVSDGHSRRSTRGSGNCLRKGDDPLHPGRSGRRQRRAWVMAIHYSD